MTATREIVEGDDAAGVAEFVAAIKAENRAARAAGKDVKVNP
jgi:hypothetical protein